MDEEEDLGLDMAALEAGTKAKKVETVETEEVDTHNELEDAKQSVADLYTEIANANNKLVDAIDAAVKGGVMRKAFHPLAEEIRQYGNLGTHPDDDQLVNANRDSAHQVLERCASR